MRCETPWSASSGATMSARASATPMSTVVTTARPGRLRIGDQTLRELRSLGDDVFEGRPREYREDRVVQREEEQEATLVGRDRRPDAADDERDRQRQE